MIPAERGSLVSRSSAQRAGNLAWYIKPVTDPTTQARSTSADGAVEYSGDPRLTAEDREALLEVVNDDEYRQLLDTIPITVPDLSALL